MAADSVANLIAGFGFAAAVAGLVFTARQMKRNTATQRGMLFKELYEPFFSDERLRLVFDLIEEKQPIFELGFGGGDNADKASRQAAVERAFAHFEVICSLQQRGLLDRSDMSHFDYNIQRLINHEGFREYRKFLEVDWPKQRGVLRGPYSSFFKYVEQNASRLSLAFHPPNWTPFLWISLAAGLAASLLLLWLLLKHQG
ncbi:hypothetical protein ABIF90_000136 [Bradyrhizobium japonicum]